jgi:cellulose synthase/poly-beta-1,6-N-acetylglucosamine synthase-like glycosyltransferase
VQYLQNEIAKDPEEFTPPASVIVPCRGVDQELEKNISALFAQDYPSFEVIFVSDRADDPAFAVVQKARNSFADASGPIIRFVEAQGTTDTGQKVHNLRVAVVHADRRSEVLVFVDTDARPQSFWLRALVAPLHDDTLAATTGYRWFVPLQGGFASHLRSVWNAAIASALGADLKKNFCWGGSTAIRREVFERLNIAFRWRGTVSDDFTVTRTIHEAGLSIKFVAQCLTPSFEDCSVRELIEFTTRQLKITRVYAPHLWKSVLTGSVIFVLAFFGGISLIAYRAAMGEPYIPLLALILIIFALGAMKSHLRLRAVCQVIRDPKANSFPSTLAHLCLWPLASALYLFNALAAVSRRITWRGITYKLKSSTETVIIKSQKSE